MKRFLFLVTFACVAMFAACEYDDSALVDRMDGFESRLERLEELCAQMNTNISSLQTIVNALQQKDFITTVAPINKDGKEVGYSITFSSGKSITIYHGNDGKDGADGTDGKTPQIGVKQDADGVYYWTVDGEWLTDADGAKIQAAAEDGTDGEDGKDGTTPQLKIEDDYWYVSYDNGATWSKLGKATGEDGSDGSDGTSGDNIFQSVTQDANNVYFKLADGTTITIPKSASAENIVLTYIPRYSDGKATVFYNEKSDSYVELDFEVSPASAAANWRNIATVKAVYTETRAGVEFVDMAILDWSTDTTKGTITVKASGKNLSDAFFAGTQDASARLVINGDGVNIISDYVPMVAISGDDAALKQTHHTLLYYFVGSDLSYYFNKNIEAAGKALTMLTQTGGELAEVENRPRVLCFIQRSRTTADIVELEYADGLYEQKVLASYELPQAMRAEQMSDYLKDMIEFAPAATYGLVMGGHSRAWTLIDSPDFYATTSEYSIRRPQLRRYWERDPEALVTRFFGEGYPFFSSYQEGASNLFDITDIASALSSTGIKFEYAIYDACFMANIESLYDLRHNSKYAIASVSEIMGNGFPYDRVVPHLLKSNGYSFDLEAVCYEYYDFYRQNAGYSGSVSLVDCAELENLAAAAKGVNNSSQKEVNNDDLQYYDGLNPHLFFDFGQYMNAICADTAIRVAFQQQLDKTVTCKYTLNSFYTGLKPYRGTHSIDTEAYSGLSTSQSAKMYRTEYVTTAWYKATH